MEQSFNSKSHFDVIVVGAGPAGSIAALKIAKAGLKVALLERGKHPGSKNIFGGLLHNTPVLNENFPDLWKVAPLERHVYRKTLSFLTPESSTSLVFETEHFQDLPYNGYTIMRPVFDKWLAGEAVKQGAVLLCNCTADDLVRKDGRIAGVTVNGREGELSGNIVIAADGVLSFIAEKAGLRGPIQPEQMGLGIKLLLGMPRETINERFGLVGDEGADYALLGMAGNIRGGGFLYTNSESISIGMVVHLDSLQSSGKTPYDILNKALKYPQLAKLVRGGVPLEYSAHLVPEGGLKGIPGLYAGGLMIVGDAAGLCYTNGINLEGINLAMTSGAIAAECAIEAVQAGDFSAEKLSSYSKKLNDSFVTRDMTTFRNASGMMHIDRLFEIYPELVCAVFEKLYRVEGVPRDRILKLLNKEVRQRVKTMDLLKDGIKIGRALL
ncbi:MAG: FAD-dependent oxidoreductase [Dehalococcoidales bacterium]|nr:FAD-dependent oxidoreductase [Dehalococcoidales bacterium]